MNKQKFMTDLQTIYDELQYRQGSLNRYYELLDEDKINEEQQKILNGLDVEWNEVSDTIYWRYPTKRLNFKDFNHQNIFDLIDTAQRVEDIKRISNEIIALISNYEKESLCLEK